MYGYYFLLTFFGNVLCAVCLSNVTIDKNSVNNDSNLWYGLIKDCKDSNQSCLKNSIYTFLKNTLDFQGDMQFTSFMKFSKNSNDYNKLFSNATNVEENDDHFIENETPMEEISRSLADNTKKFFITHDIELDLPETFFLGSTLKISPRTFNDSSAVVKLEVVPKELEESVGEGRIFFKKIRKFITERLIYALIAIILVIKLLAVKILFVLPAILGAAAAKKLIFKVLLFLFPFLHNLFKWCAYTPYGTKHHIHKHQISHIHEIAHGHHHHHKPHHHHHHGVEVIAPHSHGPPDHLPDYIVHGEPPDHHHHHHPEEYYDEHEILHRKDSAQHEKGDEEDNEIDFWGQKKRRPTKIRKPTPTEIENMVLKAEKEALIKFRLQKERERIHEENLKLQEQLNNAIKLQQKLKQKSGIITSKLPIKSSLVPPPPLTVAPLIPPPIPQPAISEYSPQAQFPQNYGQVNHISNPGRFAEPPRITQQAVQNVQGSQPVASIQNVQVPTMNQHLVKVQSSIPIINQHVVAVENSVPTVSIQNAQSNVKVQNSSPPSKTAQLAIDYIKQQEILKQATNHKPSELSQVKRVDFEKPSPKPKPKPPSIEEQIYNAAAITYDQFYSPILNKIDKILSGLNFKDEPCRKRLICSMYKNPEKFSPYSNLLSAELSRDPKELQKPTKTNAAVIRFYNYVQAARDGQDKRDCLRLYTSCAINTEDQKLF